MFEDDYDGIGGVDYNPYQAPMDDQCEKNCFDTSAGNIMLYTFFIFGLGVCSGIILGVFLC